MEVFKPINVPGCLWKKVNYFLSFNKMLDVIDPEILPIVAWLYLL